MTSLRFTEPKNLSEQDKLVYKLTKILRKRRKIKKQIITIYIKITLQIYNIAYIFCQKNLRGSQKQFYALKYRTGWSKAKSKMAAQPDKI